MTRLQDGVNAGRVPAPGQGVVPGVLAARTASASTMPACIIASVESYVRFVEQDGRSPDQYRAFVARTLRETVFLP